MLPGPTVPVSLCSTPEYGFNGMFRLPIDGKLVRCVVSDGMGWQHVSVSIEYENKPPTWGMMCKIKDLFWDDEDVVIQFHPKKSEYVNHHSGCLHLWRCVDGLEFPLPDPRMVGPIGKDKFHP